MNPTFDDSGTPTNCKEHALAYWLAHPLTSGRPARAARDLLRLRAMNGP